MMDAKRRVRAKSDLEYFLREYLPGWFKKPFGKNHKRLIEALQDRILHGGRQAVAMPRGTGKSTIVAAAAIWALIYGHRRFLVILAANSKEARKMLGNIRTSFEEVGFLLEDFPEVVYPLRELHGSSLLARGQLANGEPTDVTISAESLRLPNISGSKAAGASIVTIGVKAAIRGQSCAMPDGTIARPDFLILDDVQTDDDARNPVRIEALEHKIASTIEGLAESGTVIPMVITCTVIESGDFADRILNHEIYPHWNGIRGQMIDLWPERMDLWREYRSRRFTDPDDANSFYQANLEEMRRGAIVSWPEDYDPKHTVDALQSAMNEWAKNERAFMSEKQNAPIRPVGSAVCVPSEIIMSRVNGLDRRVVPNDAIKVTSFVDCHDDLLYWVVVAWDKMFTGYVIDYGTFPEQSRRYFAKNDGGLVTMKTEFRSSADANLKMGLETLFSDLTNWQFQNEDGRELFRIDRILVDAKYKPEVVEKAIRLSRNNVIRPARGSAILARNKEMSSWKQKPGRVFGWHCLEERIEGRAFRSLLVDTNYWKSKLHEKFALSTGDQGGISFWGDDKKYHRMVSEHCNAETVQLVSAGEREVNEWREKPGRPDNHFFDCLVGATLAASTLGLKTDDSPKDI